MLSTHITHISDKTKTLSVLDTPELKRDFGDFSILHEENISQAAREIKLVVDYIGISREQFIIIVDHETLTPHLLP